MWDEAKFVYDPKWLVGVTNYKGVEMAVSVGFEHPQYGNLPFAIPLAEAEKLIQFLQESLATAKSGGLPRIN